MSEHQHHQHEIQVTVTFPLAAQPFHGAFADSTTAGQVRLAAMAKFGAAEDPASVFYLTHNGDRLSDDRLLADVAGHASGLKLRLVKDLVQG